MAEPPAQNLSFSHCDPPTSSSSSSSSNPLEAHFAKHRNEQNDPASRTIYSHSPTANSGSTDNSSSPGSFNASRPNGGDAPSVGNSVRSGDDATVRSGSASTVCSYNHHHSRKDMEEEEETVHLLNGKSKERYPNPYRKHQQQMQQQQQQKRGGGNRVSFANQLFGKTYDSSGSVVGSISGSVSVGSSSSGIRRKVPRLNNYSRRDNSNSMNHSNGTTSFSSSTVFTAIGSSILQHTIRISHIKKNATILSILALGMMIFIGGAINLTGSISDDTTTMTNVVEMKDDSIGRGATLKEYDNTINGEGGIMNNIHPQQQHSNNSKTKMISTGGGADTIDWNKVPPHLRGYYSKTFGNPNTSQNQLNAEASAESAQVNYRNNYNNIEDNDYEHSQFSNKEQAMAIQNIGREAVLGYRNPGEKRDYHEQGLLNKELTHVEESDGGGFNGPLVDKDAFAVEEEGGLGQSPPLDKVGSDALEEEKRLSAQEAALNKAATAEADARKRRQDELTQLRAAAGLSGAYYPEGQPQSVEGAGDPRAAKEEEAKQQIELVREQIKQEAEVAQQITQVEVQSADDAPLLPASPPKDAEAEAMAKIKEEIRQRNEEAALQQEQARHKEEEKRLRDELAAREQELARQRAADKVNRLKLEYAQQQTEEERQKHGSLAQQLMFKYASVPFKEQTKSLPVEEKVVQPQESLAQASHPLQVEQQQQQQPPQPSQEQSQQNLPDISEWRSNISAKFQERLKADEKVDHTAIQPPGQAKSPHQTSLLTEKPRQQEKPEQETNYRLQIANGQLPFDEWRSMMAKKLHALMMEERAKNAPAEPNSAEVKEKVSQKMEEVEQAQNAVMTGKSTDLDSITALQKELSELMSLLGGGG